MGKLYEEPLMLYDAGDGEMIYQNNRYYPVSRAYLERISDAIQNTLKCFDNDGIDDIYLDKLETEEKNRRIQEEKDRYKKEKEIKKFKPKDHLYLIQNTENKCFKIGRSKNPKGRLKQLQIASHEKLILLFVLEEKGELEKEFHYIFDMIRLNSEWFHYDDSIIKKFKSLLNK